MRPMADHERVLGQIERGEVRAGPDAAREIAARHEAAYGDVWRTPAVVRELAPETTTGSAAA